MKILIDPRDIAAFRRASLRSLLGQRRGRVTMPGIRRNEVREAVSLLDDHGKRTVSPAVMPMNKGF
jgi:hypothetical protein